jgi:hypothetical protein
MTSSHRITVIFASLMMAACSSSSAPSNSVPVRMMGSNTSPVQQNARPLYPTASPVAAPNRSNGNNGQAQIVSVSPYQGRQQQQPQPRIVQQPVRQAQIMPPKAQPVATTRRSIFSSPPPANATHYQPVVAAKISNMSITDVLNATIKNAPDERTSGSRMPATPLVSAKALIDRLDENHEKLSKAFKQAKKGKKHRAILNASLGATTGLSPVILSDDPDSYRTISAIGGTTVLTLGTLEATEVIGKSKNEILDKLKINVEIRNQLQLEGDNFARKYALKSARRDKAFDSDRDKLLPIINNQKLEFLELSAEQTARPKYDNKEIKKTFVDFSEE